MSHNDVTVSENRESESDKDTALLTSQQVAARLGVSRSRVYQLRSVLRAVPVPYGTRSMWFFPVAAVENYERIRAALEHANAFIR